MVGTRPKSKIFGAERQDGGNGDWYQNGWSRDGEGLPIPTARLGFWLFLSAVAMLFAAFSSAYLVRMPMPDWLTFTKPPILWLNTFILVVSSGTMHWSLISGRRGNLEGLRKGLVVTTVLGVSFVLGQLLAWQQLKEEGVYLQTNPASSFFYLLTAMHGLHLLGGIVALIWVTVRAWRHSYIGQNLIGVELCAFYWHFLLLVWIWLFVLISLT